MTAKLELYRVFREVAETGNISAAATKHECVAKHGTQLSPSSSLGDEANATSTLPERSRPSTLWLRPLMI